jgi:hypothetical protein
MMSEASGPLRHSVTLRTCGAGFGNVPLWPINPAIQPGTKCGSRAKDSAVARPIQEKGVGMARPLFLFPRAAEKRGRGRTAPGSAAS